MRGVGLVEAGVVDVEGVAVLHRELAAAEQAGAGPRLVPELGLDLVERERQVLVRRVQVLHQEREHLLVGGAEEEVVAPAVLEPEEVGPVLGPPVGRLVGLARQQRGEVHLLRAHRVHLLADDALDVAEDPEAQRQPGEPAGRGPPDVAGPDEQPVAGHLRVGRVVAQGPKEQGRHPQQHGDIVGLPADTAITCPPALRRASPCPRRGASGPPVRLGPSVVRAVARRRRDRRSRHRRNRRCRSRRHRGHGPWSRPPESSHRSRLDAELEAGDDEDDDDASRSSNPTRPLSSARGPSTENCGDPPAQTVWTSTFWRPFLNSTSPGSSESSSHQPGAGAPASPGTPLVAVGVDGAAHGRLLRRRHDRRRRGGRGRRRRRRTTTSRPRPRGPCPARPRRRRGRRPGSRVRRRRPPSAVQAAPRARVRFMAGSMQPNGLRATPRTGQDHAASPRPGLARR